MSTGYGPVSNFIDSPYDIMTCQSCARIFDGKHGMVINTCFHKFCIDCIMDAIDKCDTFDLPCLYTCKTLNCAYNISKEQILLTDIPALTTRYLAKQMCLRRSKNKFNLVAETPENLIDFNLDYYGYDNNATLKPRRSCHSNTSCEDSSDDDDDDDNEDRTSFYDEVLAIGDALNCPGCDITISKISGCDYVQCTLCKTDICWATRGPRWGVWGEGDISGGCRCNVEGQKCHPDCRNCH